MKKIEESIYYDEITGKLYKEITIIQSKGYIRFTEKGKSIYAHRFIWEKLNGKIPERMSIDHINHNKKDNRLENLRLVTNQTNHRNMPLRRTNKSGYQGVYKVKNYNKWNAQINDGRNMIFLGSFKSLEEAIKIRKEAEVIYNYHPNHGK